MMRSTLRWLMRWFCWRIFWAMTAGEEAGSRKRQRMTRRTTGSVRRGCRANLLGDGKRSCRKSQGPPRLSVGFPKILEPTTQQRATDGQQVFGAFARPQHAGLFEAQIEQHRLAPIAGMLFAGSSRGFGLGQLRVVEQLFQPARAVGFKGRQPLTLQGREVPDPLGRQAAQTLERLGEVGRQNRWNFFFKLRALPFPGGLLGQFGVAAGQCLETGVSLDGLSDKGQFLGADTLAVVPAIFVALQQVVGALGEDPAGAWALVGLLAEVAADHGIDAGHLLEELGSFLLA